MKYYTIDWCLSKLSDHEIDNIYDSYQNYMENIFEKIPFTMKILTRNIDLHDGLIKKVKFYKQSNMLTIYGIFGDLQIGYFLLELSYMQVQNIQPDKLERIFKNQNIEILSDEFELLNTDLFAHRMLFSNGNEIEYIFKNIEIKMSNVIPEYYKKEDCVFQLM